jgi:hypothetical protein
VLRLVDRISHNRELPLRTKESASCRSSYSHPSNRHVPRGADAR